MFNTPRAIYRKRLVSPCYGCEDRQVGCHGSCERYAKYHKENRASFAEIANAYKGERIAEAFEVVSRVNSCKKIRQKQGGYKRR
jgi:hypothetical protein